MDLYINIRIGDSTRSIRFEHQLTGKDLGEFARSEGYDNFTDMLLNNSVDNGVDEVYNKVIDGDIDYVVEDYIKYELCMEEALKRFLTYIYKDEAYSAFNNWVDDQIEDFGREYFMLEV